MAGRPNRLFEERMVAEICELIEVGNYVPTACAAVGISESTYYRWLSDGLAVEDMIASREDGDDLRDRMRQGELVIGLTPVQVRSWEFRDRVLRASARSEAFAVAMVRKHMPDQWTAAMTFLERRFPGRWKRKEQIDIGDADTGGQGIDETLLLADPEAVKLVHRALERVAKGEIAQIAESVEDATVVPDSPVGDDESPAA